MYLQRYTGQKHTPHHITTATDIRKASAALDSVLLIHWDTLKLTLYSRI